MLAYSPAEAPYANRIEAVAAGQALAELTQPLSSPVSPEKLARQQEEARQRVASARAAFNAALSALQTTYPPRRTEAP